MQTTESNEVQNTVNGRKCAVVVLGEPLQRGEEMIASLQLMKPRTGDLRGLQIADVLQMEVGAIATVLTRISVPTLVKHEVDNLDPADFVACAMEVASFLVPKSVVAQLQA